MNITTALRKAWQGLVYACVILLIISVLYSSTTGGSPFDALFPAAAAAGFVKAMLGIP